MLRRWPLALGMLAFLSVLQIGTVSLAPSALADSCSSSVDGREDKYGTTVTVGVTCTIDSGGSTSSGSSGTSGCHDGAGHPIACTFNGYAWTPSLGFYCQVSGSSKPPPASAVYENPDGTASGRWYSCLTNLAETWKSTLFWLDIKPVVVVDAAAVAHHLVDSVGLIPPDIGVGAWVDPGFEAWGRSWWVGAPLWLWIDNSADPTAWGWHTLSATQAGVTVTASVSPSQVTFTTGDGGSVTCASPGTTRWYTPTDLLSQHSPSGCEYTYQQTNTLGDPTSRYTVSATVTWSVTYHASDGQHGGFTVQTHSTDNPTIHVGQLKTLRR